MLKFCLVHQYNAHTHNLAFVCTVPHLLIHSSARVLIALIASVDVLSVHQLTLHFVLLLFPSQLTDWLADKQADRQTDKPTDLHGSDDQCVDISVRSAFSLSHFHLLQATLLLQLWEANSRRDDNQSDPPLPTRATTAAHFALSTLFLFLFLHVCVCFTCAAFAGLQFATPESITHRHILRAEKRKWVRVRERERESASGRHSGRQWLLLQQQQQQWPIWTDTAGQVSAVYNTVWPKWTWSQLPTTFRCRQSVSVHCVNSAFVCMSVCMCLWTWFSLTYLLTELCPFVCRFLHFFVLLFSQLG